MSSWKRRWEEFSRFGHIPVLIILQIIFIILFGRFVIYNPENAQRTDISNKEALESINVYPMFQDVHVMMFIGFGFLMTFLKKYGLSAVSLNMLCASICLQWATLVIGFFHFHTELQVCDNHGHCHTVKKYPSPGYIYLDLGKSMLVSDFAAAAVLISFGVVIGKTTPLQLIFMSLVEIVLYVVNEVIGRNYLGAIDSGDTIFVHLFGAYFGLAVSKMIYSKTATQAENQESRYTSDLFSMVGTIFLWMFWPSFNAASAVAGEPQHRAILNTYYSLTASVLSSFAFSALLNKHKKFSMEHIQNATLAGGVAIGASADLFIQPFGSLIVGSLAGMLSTAGFEFVTPILRDKLKIHDTCGVHNLHGMPGLFGALISCIVCSLATFEEYGQGYYDIMPLLSPNGTDSHGNVVPQVPLTPAGQAKMQLASIAVTLAISIVGGIGTGIFMDLIARCQGLHDNHRKGETIMKLAFNVGTISSGAAGMVNALPPDAFFDDNLFFEVHDDEKAFV